MIFLVEETGERIPCLLNPESLLLQRRAGVRTRRGAGGKLTGAGRQHDPLLGTGGGQTDLSLGLLFDVHVGGASMPARDVRDLTGPLWRLAEGGGRDRLDPGVPVVRFLWGRSWNLRVAVTEISERFERFSPSGVPERSWVSVRLRQLDEDAAQRAPVPEAPAEPARAGGT